MDLTSDKGRICVWEYHGGAHQLFNIIPTELDLDCISIVICLEYIYIYIYIYI